MHQKIVLGTRGSELAVAQARMVVDRLKRRCPELDVETKIIKTRGDDSKTVIIDLRAGRKGLFTGEIERALIAREVDLAVHSAKDLPSNLAPGTGIGAALPRAPVDDILVAIAPCDLQSLPANAAVATGSVRRKYQLGWQRPDLQIIDLHGNVPTRLQKLAREQWHAIILARAGLERLGLNVNEQTIAFEGIQLYVEFLPQEIFLPAGGQGVIVIQTRTDNDRIRMLLEPINDPDTWLCLRAEREFLRFLHADCNQPVGVLATLDRKTIRIRAQVFDLKATAPRAGVVEGPCEDAEKVAERLFIAIDRK